MDQNVSPRRYPVVKVTVWIDAACPFAWATSRWLVNVSRVRDIDLEWRLMSLAVLNEGREVAASHRQRMELSWHSGRLLAAAQRAGGSAILGQVYASIGAAVHERSQPLTVDVAAAALAAGNLDAVPATVIDDPFWDQYVRESHRRSQDALGQEGGSPIVAFDGHTYFGPVITAIPSAQNSAQLFDAVYTVATAPGFSQLQKPRSGPPIFAAST